MLCFLLETSCGASAVEFSTAGEHDTGLGHTQGVNEVLTLGGAFACYGHDEYGAAFALQCEVHCDVPFFVGLINSGGEAVPARLSWLSGGVFRHPSQNAKRPESRQALGSQCPGHFSALGS